MLIVASASKARAELLRAAGVDFVVKPANIDEATITASMLGENAPPRDIADALADMKARRVASRSLGNLVLGVDQVLFCSGKLVDKAADLNEVAETLRFLRGKQHELFSAAVVYENNTPVWRHVGRVQLHMRDFTESFLQGYIERNGEALLASVGCYQLEGEGAQLFSRIDGDYFTVLGMPLLAVLGFLRTRGILPE